MLGHIRFFEVLLAGTSQFLSAVFTISVFKYSRDFANDIFLPSHNDTSLYGERT